MSQQVLKENAWSIKESCVNESEWKEMPAVSVEETVLPIDRKATANNENGKRQDSVNIEKQIEEWNEDRSNGTVPETYGSGSNSKQAKIPNIEKVEPSHSITRIPSEIKKNVRTQGWKNNGNN